MMGSVEGDRMELTVLDTADPAEVESVHQGLGRYNAQFAVMDHRRLYVFLRDAGGRLVGGLLGDTNWGWLFVSTLWIDERLRGQGYGTRLLAAAEEEGRQRGCRHVMLDTLSFQARPFYEQRGYQVYAALEDFPAGSGHTRYYLRKEL